MDEGQKRENDGKLLIIARELAEVLETGDERLNPFYKMTDEQLGGEGKAKEGQEAFKMVIERLNYSFQHTNQVEGAINLIRGGIIHIMQGAIKFAELEKSNDETQEQNK